MKRKKPKAKFVRGAEEMFDEMWAWGGKGIRSRPLLR